MTTSERASISSPSCSCCTFLEGETYKNRYRSWVLLSLALVIVSSSSGLVYGWPALRLQLLSEASVGDDNIDENDDGSPSTSSSSSSLTEEQFGLIFTIGSWSTQGGRFFLGLARDRFGTKIVTCFSLIVVVAGMVGVGVSGPNQMAFLNVSLFAIGIGSGAQLCVQPVAGLFPNHAGIVLSSLSGAFQISGLVFLLLTTTAAGEKNNRLVFFLALAACMLVLIMASAIILPKSNSFLLPEDIEEKDKSCHRDDKQTVYTKQMKEDDGGRTIEENNGLVEVGESPSEVEQELTPPSNSEPLSIATKVNNNNPTALEQMKTPEYILLCTWFSICIVPMQYYVGIIGFQLEELGDETGLYTDVFSYCYAGAAITAPLMGWFADRFGLGLAQGVATLLVAVPFFALAAKDVSSSLDVQTIGLACYGIGRMGIFGLYFTNCGKRFGYSNYGTLAGLGLLITAFVSLLQYPLIAWTVRGYSALVNYLLGIALILQVPYFVWLHRRIKCYESAISKGTAEDC